MGGAIAIVAVGVLFFRLRSRRAPQLEVVDQPTATSDFPEHSGWTTNQPVLAIPHPPIPPPKSTRQSTSPGESIAFYLDMHMFSASFQTS